jgi:hypothetical protein
MRLGRCRKRRPVSPAAASTWHRPGESHLRRQERASARTRALTNPSAPVRAGGLLFTVYGTGTLAVLSPTTGASMPTRMTVKGLTDHVVPATLCPLHWEQNLSAMMPSGR